MEIVQPSVLSMETHRSREKEQQQKQGQKQNNKPESNVNKFFTKNWKAKPINPL